ncbi:DUF6778 family protein [Microvirga flavescens]|uniref:DUF6778 family protein n=1 Tax=Microvirga flavescens TaxID=2249811 RepID=UPI0013006B19|nr:DUF6778 family protein [Microvirga flavescens]
MFKRFLAVAVMGLALAGCVSTPNTLSPEQIAGFRLASVDVSVAPNAWISWADGDTERAALTAPDDAKVRQSIASKLRDSVLRNLGGDLTGQRPVKLVVRVHEFAVVPGAVRILLGGNHVIKADVDILDAKTGAPLLAFPAHTVAFQGGNGVIGVALDNIIQDDPADRLIRYYVNQYRNWLLRK